MADNNIFSSLFGSQNQGQPPDTPPSAAVPSAPVPATSPSSTGADVFSGLFGGNNSSAEVSSPNNGQPDEPVKHLYQDETQPWYKRAGDWLNTPLTESLFGLPEDRPGAGGIERGLEHIASGLTSPLSIGLTAATFGTGGLLESAGMTALKESGEFGAEELPQILKAAQTAVDTYKAAPESATAITDAVKASGVDPALWNRAQTFLYDNGLSEHDLLGGNLLERGAFQVLRKAVPDLPVSATVRAAKTANTMLNAGFTLQQLESASAMSPRFLDALKEGDYDKAMEYGTEVFASGVLGVLGASHALHSAGELFKPLIENDAFRPNDHWLQIDRANKEREAQHAVAEQEAINLDQQTREILGHAEPGFLETVFGGSEEAKNRKNLELATVFHNVVTGGDRVKAAQWYNALSEALGREDRLPVPGELGPNNGQVPPAAPNEDVQALAKKYTASAGIDKDPHEGLLPVDPEAAQKVADAYEKMEHNPDDPQTKAAYDALIRETKSQWDAAKAAGYKLEPWEGPGQPYADSREMAEDVRNNKHLFYFQGGDIPESHPLAGIDPETGETYNNIFRAVHDLFGHAKNGYEFGPRGEENAFLAHSRMYSDEAIPALLTETKGQNSWVNFGGHLRDENGNLPTKGEAGYIPPAERPFAEQKAGILPPSIVNQHLQKEPMLGQPLKQVPSREGTKVVHSNDAGEVRVGADGRPVVWLTPEDWDTFREANHLPSIRGASFSPGDAEKISSNLSQNKQIQDLFDTATKTSPKGLLTTGRNNVDVQIASEELHHTWERELSQDGEISNLFKPDQWDNLYGKIPEDWQKEMDADGYHEDPVVRVAETAAQFRSGKANGIIPDTDIVRFLDAFYSEIESNHGKSAVEAADKINDIAAQHIKDINENRRERSTAEASELADKAANRRKLSGVEAGRQARAPEVGSGEPQEGLASREEEQEYSKLSRLSLRGGMGDPNSAGLITGDNEVFVGRYHDDLAKEAGYKEPAKGPGNIHDALFRDGGVRIRGAGGVVHIDFMEPNADTWDRVYKAIQSVPDANKYYVDFRPIKNGTGFHIDAYDKDSLVYRLKDLEEGKERPPAPVGSVAYFRNGMFSREEENTPAWYLKSNSLIDQRMQGPMPADTVLKMLENNGVKPDEMKYTGLSDFLKDKGKEPVRPEELKKFLDANNLQIQEVTKGGIQGWTQDDNDRLDDLENRRANLTEAEEAERSSLISQENKAGGQHNVPLTKFGSYALPGGQNYREMLLTLPDIGEVRHVLPKGSLGRTVTERHGQFLSSHWDEPNVVGHVRFNDRVGPNGEKLLHLEELQSDWHQAGRARGYKGNADTTGWTATQGEGDPASGPVWEVRNAAGRWILGVPRQTASTPEAAIAHAVERADRSPDAHKVPDAPFKKTWPELLMKRMIQYAAEHGYDGISWTPGEEQVARYDLSKHVGEIDYTDRNRLIVRDTNGNVVHNDIVPEEKLPEIIGKEAAQKLVDTEPRNHSGLGSVSEKSRTLHPKDLKIGGEGMKGFYDKIVPEMANKLGKQFGTKVQSTTIEAGKYPLPEDWNPGDAKVRHIGDQYQVWAPNSQGVNSLREHFASEKEASDFIDKHQYGYKKATRVPYFPITDSMRESVMKQGQPLFSRESPNNGQDPQLQHQIDTNVFKNQPKDYQDLVMDSLRRNAMGELSDREIQASKKLKDEQDRNYEIGSSNDLLHSYIEDYMTRVYKDTNPAGKLILSDAKGGKFATNVTMAKQRVYDSNLTALLKSPKQMLLDPVDITARGRASLIKAAANRQLIDNLRDKFTRASDGRPAVVLSGAGQPVTGQNGEDPRIFIDPNRVRKINIDPKAIEQMSASGDLDKYLANGTVRDITPYVRPNNIGAAIDRLEEQAGRSTPVPDEHGQNPLRTQVMLLKSMQANGDFTGLKDFNDALEKKYAWDPQDYVSLANNAMKGWNFITNSPDGTPVYVRSDIKVHPEFAEYLKNRLGLAPSEIAKNPIGKALLGAGSKLKQTLLSLSPFHMVQEALRGIMVGVNPFRISEPDILHGEKVDPSDPNSPTVGRKLVENGLTTGTDYKAKQSSSEGVSSGGGILNKIPGVGKVIGNSLNWYQEFLFDRYIPGLKYRAAELMYHEYQRLHPDWSVDRIAKAAALHANDTFGGINWQAMGRSATTQDWGRLMLLAPDWLESEMRSGARLFNKEEGGLGRAQVVKMALGLWGIARVLNLVTTGNAHYEAPFGLATKNKEGKETIFSIRTLPTDLLHAASDPVGFIKGRLSPAVRMGQELVSERDQFGRKLQPSDLWVDVFRNMAPIPLQAVGQAVSGLGPDIGNVGQAAKAIGGTATVYRTPAQKMAADLASNHTPDGVVDPASMARHRRIIQLEDQARAGEISWPDLYKLTYATDQLKPDELKRIETNVKETKDMDPGLAALYSRASRLPAKDYLDLLDVMNNSEKAALAPLTLKVQKRYLNAAKKNMTPEERQKDPTFQRFLNMVGQHPMSQSAPPIPAPVQQEAEHLSQATGQ